MGYIGKDPNGGDKATCEPPKKRQYTILKTEKGYKKDFDPPPLELSMRLLSLRKAGLSKEWLLVGG